MDVGAIREYACLTRCRAHPFGRNVIGNSMISATNWTEFFVCVSVLVVVAVVCIANCAAACAYANVLLPTHQNANNDRNAHGWNVALGGIPSKSLLHSVQCCVFGGVKTRLVNLMHCNYVRWAARHLPAIFGVINSDTPN